MDDIDVEPVDRVEDDRGDETGPDAEDAGSGLAVDEGDGTDLPAGVDAPEYVLY
ncbi:arsenic-transporting ATPase, partial [Halorubrum sp. SD626R]